jgi:hypothetical protein
MEFTDRPQYPIGFFAVRPLNATCVFLLSLDVEERHCAKLAVFRCLTITATENMEIRKGRTVDQDNS